MSASTYCKQCKLWNPPETTQCLKCGRSVVATAVPPSEVAGAKIVCPKCKFLNVGVAKRCLQCQTSLVERYAASTAPAEPPTTAAVPARAQASPRPAPTSARPAGRPPGAPDSGRPTTRFVPVGGPPPGERPTTPFPPPPGGPSASPPRARPRPADAAGPATSPQPPTARIPSSGSGRLPGATRHPSEQTTRSIKGVPPLVGNDSALRGETIRMQKLDLPSGEVDEEEDHAEPIRPPVSNLELNPGDDERALAWLCCDPFSPVPVGTKGLLTLGRAADCDMILPHESVSRVHAVIRSVGQDMVVEDRSTYGTYVNGERVRARSIAAGDTLRLGPYEIAVRPPGKDGKEASAETRPLRTFETSEAMQGRLEKVSLGEVLQQIEFNEKTGTLRVWNDDLQGQLTVYQGKPIWAELGGQRDDEAVLGMLTLPRGNFSFMAKVEPGEQSMHGSLTALLLEATRRMDEE